MNNQRGEVVTIVMVVMMVGMMVFGMASMRGGHGDSHDKGNVKHEEEHVGMGRQLGHEGKNIPAQTPVATTEESK